MEKPINGSLKPKRQFGFIKLHAKELDDGYLDRTPIFQFMLLSLLIPLWAAAASLNNILITQFKTIFTLSNAASAFVNSAFYLGYFILAIPASRIIKKTSYKFAILMGLTLYTVGCWLFFPASHLATYGVFLIALFAIACGLSFLETSANTFSTLMGPKSASTVRLNISQIFYPIGAVAGILLGKYLVFNDGASLESTMAKMHGAARLAYGQKMLQQTLLPYKYIIIVLIVGMLLFALTQFPSGRPHAAKGTKQVADAKIGETLSYLIHNKEFMKGIGTEFIYMGMQTAVWSFTITLAMSFSKTITERDASTFMVYSYIAFFLGKIIATSLMKRFQSSQVLMGFSVIGVLALIYVMLVPNITAIYFAILASGLFGPGWPTIYSQTLNTVKDKRYTETAGAIVVMSIIGGAVSPLLQGAVADMTGSISLSFVINVISFAVVGLYAYDYYQKHQRVAN
ncbi:L-fucose:H+ symporter permease [Lactiplantibacillus pingfangensis]|uniref:L-fucose:H+ symporter permease n=1 Tax=Lactiplantibacillus pingfangensis TaxID=2559915 RepID=UPI0010F56C62|nr:L-fucose:H+ symporter permease [Lactiplantibacillus pingfangensis]